MSRARRWTLGAAWAVAAAVSIGVLTRAPYAAEPPDVALLRLSWRLRGELVEECRRRTPEELERLPAHMRRVEVCDRRVAPYRLRFSVDGERLADQVVRAAGAREDRPLYVFRERPLAPGPRRLRVSFVREGATAPAPSALVLDTLLALKAGQVALVTFDADVGELVVRTTGR